MEDKIRLMEKEYLLQPEIKGTLKQVLSLLEERGCKNPENVLIGAFKLNKVFPVSEDPLHQRHLLRLAYEFKECGLDGIYAKITEELNKCPKLSNEIKEQMDKR